jgi:hypothetical protein
MRRYGSIFVKDVWSQDIKLASRYIYFLNSWDGPSLGKLLARLLPVQMLAPKEVLWKTQTYWARLYLNLMPNLQQEEIVAVLVILNFVGNSSIWELQKHYVNGSERVRMVTAMHLRLLNVSKWCLLFCIFFNLGSIHRRTDSTLSDDAGNEPKPRTLAYTHLIIRRLHLIHNWAKISAKTTLHLIHTWLHFITLKLSSKILFLYSDGGTLCARGRWKATSRRKRLATETSSLASQSDQSSRYRLQYSKSPVSRSLILLKG